jgi:intracellular septation protein A
MLLSVTAEDGGRVTPAETSNASREGNRAAGTGPAGAGRFRSIAMIVIFYVAIPLAAYYLLRSAGVSAVGALLLSGVFPAVGVAIGVIRHRRLDVVGALVLAGIIVGTVLALISGNAKFLLVEGSVPTAVFGAACLISLRTRRPLMFSLALEFTGPDSAKGREMTTLWQYDRFQHIFRIITAVWGLGFFLEAALRVVIVYNTSTGTALATSNATPFIWTGVLSAWTVAYGARQRKKGEAAGHVPAPYGQADEPSSQRSSTTTSEPT